MIFFITLRIYFISSARKQGAAWSFLIRNNFNHKLGSVHNRSLAASLSLPDNFCADQPGTERRLFPNCQLTYIFWIGQIQIRHLVVLP